MNVLSLSTIFPSAVAPAQGVFIKERLKGLAGRHALEVWRCRPWCPGFRWFRKEARRPFPKKESVDGVLVRDLRFPYVPGVFKTWDGPSLAVSVQRALRDSPFRPDLLDAHFAYPAGYAAVRVAERLGIPSVITLRGTFPSYLADRRRGRIREALLGATRVVAVSRSLADEARRLVGRDVDFDCRVIPNGIDTGLFRPGERDQAVARLGLPPCRPLLLTVGGLVPRKGAHRVIRILPRLLERHPDLLYVLVGGGSVEGDFRRDLEASIRDLGLGDRVLMLGERPHEELADFYRAADLFVLSTSNEGWANVLQESLACGTPVVTTDVGGNREVVGAEDHGLVVPFDDEDGMAAAILEALDRSWNRTAISKWGRRQDWDDVAEDVSTVFEEALGEF
ncbi:MAG TPA: glycosyltransferase family 4 protein [Planctomycetes bacterium]|nr:glycosyltransferase family 4 protein [Planctomycetota bacterium]